MYRNCYPMFNCNLETCAVEEIPNYVNFHTHTIHNQIKRHVNVPVYSNSCETRVIHEFDGCQNFMNMYQNPMGMNQNYPNDETNFYNNMNNDMPGFGNLNNYFVPFPYNRN